MTVPIDPETKTFAQEGSCAIAGVDGTAAELNVKFLNPAGAKTGCLLPTGRCLDVLDIPGFGKLEATILDVSNPMVLVRARDIGMTGTELPGEINQIRSFVSFWRRFAQLPAVKWDLQKICRTQQTTARQCRR